MQKAVLITGASTGIGEACAYYLAARDWLVYAGVRREEDARRLEAAGSQIRAVKLDVTQASQIEAAVKGIHKARGDMGLQGLVNNAGIAVSGPLEFLPMNELRRQFEVNFFGPAAVTQACLPLLRGGLGRVVNVSSLSGRIAAPMVGPYAASKFALEAFTDALRRELMPWKLHVCSIQAGNINTPIWEKSLREGEKILKRLPAKAQALYGPMMEGAARRTQRAIAQGIGTEAVARAVLHALSARRPRTRYIMGRGTRLTLFLARWLPDEVLDFLIGTFLYR